VDVKLEDQLEVDLLKHYEPFTYLRLSAKDCQLSSDNMAVTQNVATSCSAVAALYCVSVCVCVRPSSAVCHELPSCRYFIRNYTVLQERNGLKLL